MITIMEELIRGKFYKNCDYDIATILCINDDDRAEILNFIIQEIMEDPTKLDINNDNEWNLINIIPFIEEFYKNN